MADERAYTETELRQRIDLARSAERERAWRDLMRRFSYSQRKHLAHLMAHDFSITAIEFEDRYGSRPDRMAATVSREEANKALDEERARYRAARRDAAAGVPASEAPSRIHKPGESPRDWPEDFAHDNGCYMSRCNGCGVIFHGHKRRVSCKLCAAPKEKAGEAESGKPCGMKACPDCRTADLCAEAGCAVKNCPPEGLPELCAAAWRNVERDGEPECDGETVFVGINTAGYAACFNEFADAGRQCQMTSAEGIETVMADLLWWRVLDRPPAAGVSPTRGDGRCAASLSDASGGGNDQATEGR